MSAHRNLPIYKATYQLLRLVAEITRSIRKEYRLTLGVQVKAARLLGHSHSLDARKVYP